MNSTVIQSHPKTCTKDFIYLLLLFFPGKKIPHWKEFIYIYIFFFFFLRVKLVKLEHGKFLSYIQTKKSVKVGEFCVLV